ncbi:MAG: hypothetical protein K6T83_02805 [Alicyclobacillus sp.]|nr:hypothetical protein [Alicyclobacillus sp.]
MTHWVGGIDPARRPCRFIRARLGGLQRDALHLGHQGGGGEIRHTSWERVQDFSHY